MSNNSYIRITEAVKKYKKTRQTFYNYIRKGIVSTKKIQNKVYLSEVDIKRVLWSYLEDHDFETLSPEKNNETKNLDKSKITTTINLLDNSLWKLKEDVHSLEIAVESLPTWATESSLQKIKWSMEIETSRLQAQLINQQDYIKMIKEGFSKQSKKTNFAVWYVLLIAINTFILFFLS